MSEITRGIIQGYLEAFRAYQISDAVLQKELKELEEKMEAFAGANTDIATFYSKFAESGLQEEYSALISKVAMAGLDSPVEVEKSYENGAVSSPPSVKDFLEQYRTSYEEVKKAGYRKRGEAAYERLLAVADQTDDMLDAQIIMEKERLLWKIVSEDALDIFEPILQAMDPLQQAVTITIQNQVEAHKQAGGSEELDYLTARQELENLFVARQATSKINITAQLATLLIGYSASKLNTQLSGGQGEQGKKNLMAMISQRAALRRLLTLLKDEFGLTFENLLADEGLKIWMLSPESVDEIGRIKIALNPQNYEVFKAIINNDILQDIPTAELLKQTAENMVWYGFEGATQSEFQKKATDKAAAINAHLTYFQYKEQLAGVAGLSKERT